jgi:hypothetical protein
VGHLIFHFGGGNLITTITEGNFRLHFNLTAYSGAPTSLGKLIITGGTGLSLGAKGSLSAATTGYIIGAQMPFCILSLLTFVSHILSTRQGICPTLLISLGKPKNSQAVSATGVFERLFPDDKSNTRPYAQVP